ncbi:MAG: hypothetical protein Q9165_003108 [Trypethelium subeluteriae]
MPSGSDILFLRAKLALYFFSESANDVPDILNRERCISACPDAPQRSWPPPKSSISNGDNGGDTDKKRLVVLNSITWDIKEVADEAAAREIANNPPLECGGGFVLWINDVLHRSLKKANRRYMSKERERLESFFPRLSHNLLIDELKQYAKRRILKLELEREMGAKLAKGGTLMYYKFCRAMWKIKIEAGTQKGRLVEDGQGWRETGVVKDSDEEFEVDLEKIWPTKESLTKKKQKVVIDLTGSD